VGTWSTAAALRTALTNKKGANVRQLLTLDETAKHFAGVLSKPLKKDLNIIFCGHSIGGCVAQLVMHAMSQDGYANTHLVTFGSPRCLRQEEVSVSAIHV
jgi:surfactin synthase thioesterase subunit